MLEGPQTDQPVNFDDATETLDPPTRDNLKKLLSGLDESIEGRGEDFDRTLRRSAPALNETANLLAQVNSDGAVAQDAGRARVAASPRRSPRARTTSAAAADSTATLLSVTGRRQDELGAARGSSARRCGARARRWRRWPPRRRGCAASCATSTRSPTSSGRSPACCARRCATPRPFLDETRRLVRQARRTSGDFAPIIASARAGRSRRSATLIEQVLPLGNTLRAYIPETVGLFQNLGATMATYDANGHMINLAGAVLLTGPPASSTADDRPGGVHARARRQAVHPPSRRAGVPALGGLRVERRSGRRRVAADA